MRGAAAPAGAAASSAQSRADTPSRPARRVVGALKMRSAWLYGRSLCRRAKVFHPLSMDPGPSDPGMSPTPQPDSMILLDDVHLTPASDAGAVNVLRGISLPLAPR